MTKTLIFLPLLLVVEEFSLITNTKGYQRHYSVLRKQSIELLKPQQAGLWIDGTLGEAGHATYALQTYPNIELIGLDADAQMLERAKANLTLYPNRYHVVHQFFNDYFRDYPPEQARPIAILLDLGISMYHYKGAERGFSYTETTALDMRLNPAANGPCAADMINTYSEQALADIFWRYGQEQKSRQIAKAIVQQRKTAPISSAKALSDLLVALIKQPPGHFLHPAAKVFQALRIAVNQELARLEQVLPSAFSALEVGGKFAIITFHSLEDRIVKEFFRSLTKSCQCPEQQLKCTCLGAYAKNITPKTGISPDNEEIAQNSASRSARLRVVQKLRPYANTRGHRD